jgi:hypothetical protein
MKDGRKITANQISFLLYQVGLYYLLWSPYTSNCLNTEWRMDVAALNLGCPSDVRTTAMVGIVDKIQEIHVTRSYCYYDGLVESGNLRPLILRQCIYLCAGHLAIDWWSLRGNCVVL